MKIYSRAPRQLILKIESSGADSGRVTELAPGECVVVGRESSGTEQTAVSGRAQAEIPADIAGRANELLPERPLSTSKLLNPDVTQPAPITGLASYKRKNDLRFVDPTVSRFHALIYFDDRGAGVVDLGSTNGIEVQGRKFAHHEIGPGTVIELGNVKIRVEGL